MIVQGAGSSGSVFKTTARLLTLVVALGLGVVQARNAFIATQYQHHINYTWRYRLSCQRSAKRSSNLAKAHFMRFGHLVHKRLKRLSGPSNIVQLRRQCF